MYCASDGNGQYRQKRAPKRWQVALILSIPTIPCILQEVSQLLDMIRAFDIRIDIGIKWVDVIRIGIWEECVEEILTHFFIFCKIILT